MDKSPITEEGMKLSHVSTQLSTAELNTLWHLMIFLFLFAECLTSS